MERKKFRFGQRAQGADSQKPDGMTLTAEDERNLNDYVEKIQDTIEVLEREIEAIKDGKIEVVSAVFEEKSRVLKMLELQTPLVEPFIDHPAAQKLEIRHHLTQLKKYIEEDSTMLSRMAVAARTILREVEKINNRSALDGNYGKGGHRVGASGAAKMQVDRKL